MTWEFELVGVLDAEDPAVRGNTDVVLISAAYFVTAGGGEVEVVGGGSSPSA